MGDSWKTVGTARLSSTGRTIRLDFRDMPFTSPYYMGVEDLEELIAKRKKDVTVICYTKNEETPGA